MVIAGIAEKIKQLLEERNITQAEFAEKLGISRRNVVEILSSGEIKKLDIFVSICQILNVSPAYLLSEITGHLKDRNAQDLMKTVVEVKYLSPLGKEEIRAYIVPMFDAGNFTVIPFDFDKTFGVRENVQNVELPFFRSKQERKWEVFFETIHNIPTEFKSSVRHDRYYLSKLNDPSEIKPGFAYMTVNSQSGKGIDFLAYNAQSQEVSFFHNQELTSLQFTLPASAIYEIWKLVAVITKPFSEEYYNEPEDITYHVE